MGKVVGSICYEMKPTVTVKSAVACVVMLNLFLDEHDEYRLEHFADGDGFGWHLVNTENNGEVIGL